MLIAEVLRPSVLAETTQPREMSLLDILASFMSAWHALKSDGTSVQNDLWASLWCALLCDD